MPGEKAVDGSDAFTYEWNSALWKFASAENRAKFVEHPEKYAAVWWLLRVCGLTQLYQVSKTRRGGDYRR